MTFLLKFSPRFVFSEGAPRSKFEASPQQQLLRQEMRPPLNEPKNTRSQLVKIREESIHKSKKRPVAEHAVAAARHWLWTRRGHSKKDELWGQGSSIHISILYYLVCSDRQIIDIIIINHHLRSVPLRYGVEVSVRCKKGAVWTPALPAFRMFSFNQTLIFFLPTFRKANPGGQTVA